MNEAQLDQRLEEIELALAGIFDSPRSPSVSSYDEGARIYLQVSWVVESTGDTSLGSRCVLTLVLSRPQFDRYANADTAYRKAFQARLVKWARERFEEKQSPPALEGDCAVEAQVPDALFDA